MPESGRSRALAPALAGLALGIVAVVGWFVLVIRLGAWFPSVRNDAVPSWIAIAAGLALSVLAVVRARRRVLPAVLLGVNVVVAGAFWTLLHVTFVVPPASGPSVGAPAPSFALVDQGGTTRRLEDFRGGPLLLVFYRGHW